MKTTPILLFLTLIPSLVFAQNAGPKATQSTPSSTESVNQTLSNAELLKQIQDLVKQIQTLQAQVAALRGELGQGQATSTVPETKVAAPETTPPELTRSLFRGSSGNDVRQLQEFLAKDKEVYPDGLITGYFGPLTEAAVKRWQEKHDIEAVGVIGPRTIAKFQEIGRRVVQGLIDQGAGASGATPPGLLTAPGIQNKIGVSTTTTAGVATSTPFGASSTSPTTTSTLITTSTPTNPSATSSGAYSASAGYSAPIFSSTQTSSTTTTPTSTTTATSTTTTASTAPCPDVATVTDSDGTSYDTVQIGSQCWLHHNLNKNINNAWCYGNDSNNCTVYGRLYAWDSAMNGSASEGAQGICPSNWHIPTHDEYLALINYLGGINAAGSRLLGSGGANFGALLGGYREAGSGAYSGFGQNAWFWTSSIGSLYFNGMGAGGTSNAWNLTITNNNPNANPAGSNRGHAMSVRCIKGMTPLSPSSPPSDTQSPSVPTGLSASAISTSQINLSWTDSTDTVGVVGYKIYRGGTQIATTTASATTSTAPTTYSDSGLSPSTAYTYTVAAYDAAGNVSAQSSQTSATTQANQTTVTAFPVCDQTVKNVPGDYSSIQAALDAANSGDTVKVAAGTYNEGVAIKKSGICLEGAGIDQTVITNSNNTGITIGIGGSASYVIVKNLTVKGSGVSGCCQSGGGIFTWNTHDILLQSCRLTQNNAYAGGGLYVTNTSNLTVDHCLIDNNHVSNIAGGVLLTPQSYGAIFTNVTIVNNSANSEMGGLSYGANQNENSDLIIKNSIFWGNIGPMTSSMQLVGSTNLAGRTWTTINFPAVSYSDIGGWSGGGTNNIDADPQFISTTDYHLQSSSPAINMGVYPSAGTSFFLNNRASSLASILESLRSLMLILQKLQERL